MARRLSLSRSSSFNSSADNWADAADAPVVGFGVGGRVMPAGLGTALEDGTPAGDGRTFTALPDGAAEAGPTASEDGPEADGLGKAEGVAAPGDDEADVCTSGAGPAACDVVVASPPSPFAKPTTARTPTVSVAAEAAATADMRTTLWWRPAGRGALLLGAGC
ncbi:hypothetical protein [Kitasatospora sp. NPDC057015]|uniref:hypothetical protein n=1 Tax=Kitasatospora sp. NPDC057015 TaxID=3346001 RepID=UPI003636A697